jgi:tetratricopeptide (TPR) repeat protein
VPLGWMAEKLFGRAGLLLLWLTTGTTGAIATLLLRQPETISRGASGALFGLLGALVSAYLFRDVAPDKNTRRWCVAALIAFGSINLLADWFVLRILNWGHLGGLLAGLFLGLMLPLGSDRTLKRIMVSLAVTLLALVASALIARNRQAVWVELDEIQADGDTPSRDSIPKLQEIVTRRPDILQAHLLLAKALQQDHRNDDAIREYRYVTEKQPALLDAWAGMGSSFMDSGRYDDAIDVYSRCLQNFSVGPTVRGNRDRARKVFWAHLALARAYEAAGKLDDAMSQYREVQSSPERSEYQFAADELERLRRKQKVPVAHK